MKMCGMKQFRCFLLLASVIFIYLPSISATDDESWVRSTKTVDVQTTSGVVRGEQGGFIGQSSKHWYRFRGIPFAEPPVGNLRFEPPVPKSPWSGILDASKRGNICIQGSDPVEGDEDCLFVKIYTPQIPNPNNELPVMVWVYGGAFFTGAPDFDGGNPQPLLEEDVIVVSFHYRVGIFGFLSTGDHILHGNAGIKDQVLALNWIKSNIRNFGGNPNKITLFGQSAGASSIAYLLQIPSTKGLYNAAVMLSGNSLNSWGLSRKPLDFAKTVASNLKITTNDVSGIVNGLKQVPASELQKVTVARYQRVMVSDPSGGLPLGPVLESSHSGAVVTGKSHDLLKNGHFNEVPIIIGHTSLEAHSSDGLSSALKLLLTTYSLVPGRFVPVGMHVASAIQRNRIGNTIKTHYFGSGSILSSDIKSLRWISEDQFVRGIYESVKLYSKKVPVYYYSFGHEGALFGYQNRTLPGVGHNEDLGYLFDFGFSGAPIDYLVRDRIVGFITNFAKYQNPTPYKESLFENIVWTPNTGGNEIRQLNITERLELVTNPYNANMDFWTKCFNDHGTPPFDTF